MQPNFPKTSEHIAYAGATGSGKSVAAIDMLSRRLSIPWIMIDHKRDENIAMLPAERMRVGALIIPKTGVHVVRPKLDGSDDESLNNLLERVFKRGKCGIYVDEGHLMPQLPALRMIMVAGRSKHVPMMYCSQRASHIDPFIWSQSSFFRVFRLQTHNDIKRYQENTRHRFEQPPEYHSWYYDGRQDETFLLGPSGPIEYSAARIDNAMRKEYGRI